MPRLKPAAAAAILIVGAATLIASGVASAHSRPIRFDPAAGAVLQAAPVQVTGWFTQPLRRDSNWNYLKVTDSQGAEVSTGEPQLSADRKQMTIQLRSGLAPGRYQVTWRTWDDNDGRIFGDCHAFFVAQASADAAVTANTRLDGGNTCQRIDISGTNGTPVAGGTPQATAVPGADGHGDEDEEASASENDDGSEVPIWGLALGIAGGLAVGLVGGRVVGRS